MFTRESAHLPARPNPGFGAGALRQPVLQKEKALFHSGLFELFSQAAGHAPWPL